MARRLVTILAADVVGFSRLMETDETGTLAALQAHRTECVDLVIAQNNGPRRCAETPDGDRPRLRVQ